MALSVVYPPKASPVAPAVDIVAVHGLGGDAIDTWTHPRSNVFWLKEFLPQQISDARILTFGYNATAAFGDSTLRIVAHAKSLLASLVDKRDTDKERDRPLIFIVHSLGGIVVKQALLLARLEPRYQSICNATIGIIFFGTPHRGNGKVNYGKVLANIVLAMVYKPTIALINALKTNSRTLEQLTSDFCHQLPRCQVTTFYEQRLVKPFKCLIVEKCSTLLGIEDEEQIPVDADHIMICKFERYDDDIFEKVCKSLQHMRNRKQRTPEQAAVPYNQHYQVPHLLSPVFTGRDQISQALEASFATSTTPRQAVQQRFVLHGLGGSGKTQICLKYAQSHRERYWGIFWVDASTRDSIQQSMIHIAVVLQTDASVEAVTRVLANFPHTWLLIFDNADDPDLILTPYFPPGDRGDVIITSRNPNCSRYNTVGSKEIAQMPPNESIDLLLKIVYSGATASEVAQQECHVIVQTLGGLALAVTQAGAYIRETSCSLQDYLELYQRRRREIWKYDPKHSGTDYRYTVYTTWQVSLDMIESMQSVKSQCALKLLKLICFYHYERIPIAMFFEAWRHWPRDSHTTTDWLPWPEDVMDLFELRQRVQAYVVLLTSFSLVAKGSDGSLSLHPLVREWYRERLTEEERRVGCRRAISLLGTAVTYDYTDQDLTLRRELISHVLECLNEFELSKGKFVETNNHISFYSWDKLAFILVENRFVEDAVTVSEHSLQLYVSNFGEEHLSTITAIQNLAVIYRQAGRINEALVLTEKVVRLRKIKLGEEAQGTLRSMHHLATTYDEAGRSAEALELIQEVIRLQKSKLGEDHYDTLASMQSLAMCYQKLGRITEGIELMEQLLQLYKSSLGDEHPDTLLLMHNLAVYYGEGGRMNQALELVKEVIQTQKIKLGEENPHTLHSIKTLALLEKKIKDDQIDGMSSSG